MAKFKVSGTILLLSTIQQISVAISTYVVLETVTIIGQLSIEQLTTKITIFVIAIFSAYLSGCINNYVVRRRQNSSWFLYCQTVYDKQLNDKNIFGKIDKHSIHNWLISEAREVIADYIQFQKNTYEVAANIIFNLAAIYAAIGAYMLFVIVISICLGFVIFFLSKNKIKEISRMVQSKRVQLYKRMSFHIDRTVYVPVSDRRQEAKNLVQSFNEFRKPDETYTLLEAFPTISMVTLACIILYFGFRFDLLGEDNIIIGVVVSTPRLVQMLQYSNDLFTGAARYYYYKVRVIKLKEFASFKAHPKIKVEKREIFVNGRKFTNVQELCRYLLSQDAGRFVLTGANGSGKFTVLHMIKHERENAVLLNPENIASIAAINGSTGQKAKHALLSYLDRLNVDVLLLDEWNANLDSAT